MQGEKPAPALRVGVYVAIYVTATLVSARVLVWLGGDILGLTLSGFLGALLCNFLALRIYENLPLTAAGLQRNSASIYNAVMGFAGGAGSAGLILGGALAGGAAELKRVPDPSMNGGTFVLTLALLLCAAAGEELFFHGYGFQLSVREWGPFTTILPVSIIFAALHSGNAHSNYLGLANTAGFGILFGYAFLRSQDLWFPIGLHFGWNLTLPLFGVNISGFTIRLTDYTMHWNSAAIWSGGDYGIEGSVLTTGVLVLLFIFATRVPVRRQLATSVVALLLVCGAAHAGEKLSFDDRVEILRGLMAEYATLKQFLPRSKKPLAFESTGKYDAKHWEEVGKDLGPAARTGDQIQITKVTLESDKILLEINGGIKSGRKWYDRVEVGMGNRTGPIGQSGTPTAGTYIAILFHQPLPPMKAADVKKMLAPILDFEKRSATEIYSETLPPEIQKAIKDKKVLEGMDKEQVILAMGRPVNKQRETKDGLELEDWVYGRPPGRITFVTFAGKKVIKVKEAYAGLGTEAAAPLPPL